MYTTESGCRGKLQTSRQCGSIRGDASAFLVGDVDSGEAP